jgi:ADP-dependent NAD(P)H-hydrate dehydratase
MPKRTHAKAPDSAGAAIEIVPRLLRHWPLPDLDGAGDKEDRGSVLVVGGTRRIPGAVILAGIAALRAGAGKLQMAMPASVAPVAAVTVPESCVFGLPESPTGSISAGAADELAAHTRAIRAVLIGPGMEEEQRAGELVGALLPNFGDSTLVLDAAAMTCVRDNARALHPLKGNVVLTPHAGEMAGILGIEKAKIREQPEEIARRAARDWQAVVVLKGSTTTIATPDGTLYWYAGGGIGLATSGSGDTLAGVIAGLAARGASPEQASVWGVFLHGRAGMILAKRMGRVGFLARELLAEIPALMARLEPQA